MGPELPATGDVAPSLRVAGDGLPSLETLRLFFVIEERCDKAKSEVVVIGALWGANKRPSPPSLSKTAEGDGKRSSGLEDMNVSRKDGGKKADVENGIGQGIRC